MEAGDGPVIPHILESKCFRFLPMRDLSLPPGLCAGGVSGPCRFRQPSPEVLLKVRSALNMQPSRRRYSLCCKAAAPSIMRSFNNISTVFLFSLLEYPLQRNLKRNESMSLPTKIMRPRTRQRAGQLTRSICVPHQSSFPFLEQSIGLYLRLSNGGYY